jgi:hypothetical protein
MQCGETLLVSILWRAFNSSIHTKIEGDQENCVRKVWLSSRKFPVSCVLKRGKTRPPCL